MQSNINFQLNTKAKYVIQKLNLQNYFLNETLFYNIFGRIQVVSVKYAFTSKANLVVANIDNFKLAIYLLL